MIQQGSGGVKVKVKVETRQGRGRGQKSLAPGRAGTGGSNQGHQGKAGLQAGRPKCHSTYCALHGWHFGEGRARLMRTSRALGSRHGKTSSLIHNH